MVIGQFGGVGTEAGAAVELAVERHNAAGPRVRVELRSYATTSAAGLRALAERAVADGVYGIVGPAGVLDVAPVVQVFEDAGVPMVAYDTTDAKLRDRGWRYWHRIVADDELTWTEAARHVTGELRARKVAVLHDQSPVPLRRAEWARRGLARAGAADVRTWSYPRGFTTEFSAIAEDVKGFKADAVVVAGRAEDAGPLVRALRAAGVKAPVVGDDGLLWPGFTGDARVWAVCACLVDPEGATSPATQRFVESFRATYREAPRQPYAVEAYDAVTLFLEATAEDRTTPGVINDWIGAARTSGLTGTFRFDGEGERLGPGVHLYQVGEAGFRHVARLTEALP
ncbi:branched-chain amino acid ABC transporter substrate-binding protein [Actinocorallia sp. API 0066]|uniref:branched-chain amino acid ABC transporter substrate-binding protein n=1 Tax=Actinocorallia sp. API 0066 TaxID=2896846 RepID=UPI001E5EC163|nr:branched-chain amino acid ABC transporter substrate-binding protein [Actinocorallia sp. API 0066]MCD0452821.1 branched-chain amino acid ABC transporter substrate-binding protein [Actinocorallia sp. API 0066]